MENEIAVSTTEQTENGKNTEKSVNDNIPGKETTANKETGGQPAKKEKKSSKDDRPHAVKRTGSRRSSFFLLKAAGRIDEVTEHSIILGKIRRFIPNLKSFSFTIAAEKDSGVISAFISRLARAFLNASLGVAATFFLLFAAFGMIVTFSRSLLEFGSFFRIDVGHTLTYLVTILMSLLLFSSSGKSISQSICSGRILSFVLFDILGIEEEKFSGNDSVSGGYLFSSLLGIALGILAGFGSPYYVLIRLLIITCLLIIAFCPESGAVMLFAAIPFASRSVLVLFSLFTFLSYSFKAIIGKRSFRLSMTDFLVFVLALLSLFSGSIRESLIYIILTLSFILVTLTVRTKETAKRMIRALSYSLTLYAFLSVLSYIAINLSVLDGFGYLARISAEIPEKLIISERTGIFMILGLYSVISSGRISKSDGGHSYSFLQIAVISSAVLLTGSFIVWVTYAVLLSVFVLKKSKKLFPVVFLLFALCAFPFIADSFDLDFSPYIELHGFSVDYLRATVLNIYSSLRNAVSHFLTGTGTSGGVFEITRSAFLPDGTELIGDGGGLIFTAAASCGVLSAILLLFIIISFFGKYLIWGRLNRTRITRQMSDISYFAVMSLLSAFLIGLFRYFFSDSSLLLLFWMLCGLLCSVTREIKEDSYGIEDDDEYQLLMMYSVVRNRETGCFESLYEEKSERPDNAASAESAVMPPEEEEKINKKNSGARSVT